MPGKMTILSCAAVKCWNYYSVPHSLCTTQLLRRPIISLYCQKMFLIGSRTLKSVFGLYQAVYNRDSMRFMPPVSFLYLPFKIVSNLNQMFQITETCGLTDRSINDDSNSYDILRKIIESKDVDLAQRWCVYRNLPHEDNPDLEVRAFFFHSPWLECSFWFCLIWIFEWENSKE